MIQDFHDWFEKNQNGLNKKRIKTLVSQATQNLDKNSINADFLSDRYEATVQIWETGESDFHFLDWKEANEVVVTYHKFNSKEELYMALEQLIVQMS